MKIVFRMPLSWLIRLASIVPRQVENGRIHEINFRMSRFGNNLRRNLFDVAQGSVFRPRADNGNPMVARRGLARKRWATC